MGKFDQGFEARATGDDFAVTERPVIAAACPGAGRANIGSPDDDRHVVGQGRPGKLGDAAMDRRSGGATAETVAMMDKDRTSHGRVEARTCRQFNPGQSWESRSLVTQGFHRFHLGGATGGKTASQSRDSDDGQDGDRHRNGVVRR